MVRRQAPREDRQPVALHHVTQQGDESRLLLLPIEDVLSSGQPVVHVV
jgi:hypothetical protein